VCVESLVTALVDMYPGLFRKKNRREILILAVSVISFLVGLVMLTEVRVQETGRGDPMRRRSHAEHAAMDPGHRAGIPALGRQDSLFIPQQRGRVKGNLVP
jgi:hypothetical protein